jgi:hypothetical protein
VIFANPWAFWLLLGIPVLVGIYFLQQKSRTVLTTTLFLLDKKIDETRGGRSLRYLRNSLPLILQSLALLCLVWFVSSPSYLNEESSQRVVIVLDDFADMRPFREDTLQALDSATRSISNTAARTDWIVLFTSQSARAVFSGQERNELLSWLRNHWKPLSPRRDPAPALRAARTAAGQAGHVLHVTCRQQPPQPAVSQISSARSLDNIAIAGHSIEQTQDRLNLRLLLRSFSSKAEKRQITLKSDGSTINAGETTIAPGGLQEFSLNLSPPSDSRLLVKLQPHDNLDLDDVLPLVVPKKKNILTALHPSVPESQRLVYARFLAAVQNVTTVAETNEIDLLITSEPSLSAASPRAVAVIFTPSPNTPLLPTPPNPVTPVNHPLVRHLSFQRLLVREHAALEVLPTDEVLLWQESVPLVLLRKNGAQLQLHMAFHPGLGSNQLDASVLLLLHRFVESARQLAPRYWAQNYRASESLHLPTTILKKSIIEATPVLDDIAPTKLPATNFAPAAPGFWLLSSDSTLLASASTHFADPLCSDLRDCSSFNEIGEILTRNVQRFYSPEPWRALWLLLALLLVLAAWLAQAKLAS